MSTGLKEEGNEETPRQSIIGVDVSPSPRGIGIVSVIVQHDA
jgi:hypothetical protein